MSQLVLKVIRGRAHLVRREAGLAETTYEPICPVTDGQAAGISTWGVPSVLMRDMPDAPPVPLAILRNPDFMADGRPWLLMAGDDEIARLGDDEAFWINGEGVQFPQDGEPDMRRRALEDAELGLARSQKELDLAIGIRDEALSRVEKILSEIDDNDLRSAP